MRAAIYKSKQIYSIFIIGILLVSCKHHNNVDVSSIPVDVKIERFDHDLDDMRTKPMDQQAAFLQHKYGAFYKDFIERIIPMGSIRDTGYFKTLRGMLANKGYTDVKAEVNQVYPNLDKQEAALTDAFRHIKYYFPKKELPKVYAYLSGFQVQISIGDGYVGIGLDMFLGADSKFYPALVQIVPRYLSRRYTPDNIAPRVVEGMLHEDMFPEPDSHKTLLDKMVYAGKILYTMDKILPNLADTTKIGYTGAQMKWCEDFKPQIWGYFLEEKLLYETDDQKISKYLGEAPFTPGLGETNESAPKLGVWTGWQIVRQYMKKNPDTTLEQLWALDDGQKILNASKYRPEGKN